MQPPRPLGAICRGSGDVVFILAELSVFAILILAFAVTQQLKPQLFAESRQLLDSSTGLAMTLSLLSAGLLAALAQERVRRARPRQGRRCCWRPCWWPLSTCCSSSASTGIY